MWALTPTLVSLGAGLIIGIIGYFLKRTMSRVDKNEQDINSVKEIYTPSKTHDKHFEECKSEIKQIKEDYTPKQTHEKDFDECRNDIKQIKEDCITKEDFFREMGKFDRKLDRQDEKIDRLINMLLNGKVEDK